MPGLPKDTLALFKEVVAHASDAIGIATADGKHRFGNRAFDQLFGDIGDAPQEAYVDPAVCQEVFRTIMAGDDWSGELQMYDRDHRVVDVYLYAYPIKDAQEQTAGLVGIHTNITDRKNAERALRENQQLLRSAFESIQDGISILNPDLTIRYTNQVMKQWYAQNLPLEGKPCYACYHGTAKPCEPCPSLRCMRSGMTERVVHRGLAGSAAEWIELYSYPIHDEVGAITGVLEFVRNITDRMRAEEAVCNEKERLAVTLRSIGDAVITTDTDSRIVLLNRVAEVLTGWTQQEAAGRPLKEILRLVNEDTRRPVNSPTEVVLARGTVEEMASHTLLLARDGSERIIADSAAPITNAAGETVGVVLVFRDITEKQRLLEATQRNQKLEALGVLAAGIAHDFNNLLTGVFGYLDLAMKELGDAHQATPLLESALAAMERARGLTGQLLTFSKGGDPVRKPEPLPAFVEQTARFALSGSSVSFTVDLAPDLHRANFDRNQIAQVLDNILINAQQAMPKGGTIQITGANVELADHALLARGDYVRLSIRDSGIGIPAAFIDSIFDPFFTTKSEGHGLGLATSYSIVKRHQGAIEVESEPGKGTTFHVFLPAVVAAAEEAVSAPPSPHRGGGRILIMDDELVIRQVLQRMLIRLGYEADGAANGEDALALCRRARAKGTPYTAMIVDMTIPGGMGGKELLKNLREWDTQIPVFVASGYASDPVLADPEAHGFQGAIRKPFRSADVQALLERHFRSAS